MAELFVRKPGRLDAIALWFDLHLDDTVTIATGADSDSCWEQAIYPISSVQDVSHSTNSSGIHCLSYSVPFDAEVLRNSGALKL